MSLMDMGGSRTGYVLDGYGRYQDKAMYLIDMGGKKTGICPRWIWE